MLRAEGLVKRFGALAAVDGVDLRAEAGERLGVIGPNGAGKSTLFALLAGATRPDAGRVTLDGVDVSRFGPDRRARLGLARSFQKNALFEGLSVGESFSAALLAREGVAWRFWPGSAPRDLGARAAAAADRVGLAALFEQPVSALSYGAKRQLEIGLALVGAPKALLLDEPAAGVGPEERRALRALIAELPREIAVVVVEHDMDLVFDLCDRLQVLAAGRTVFDGDPAAARRSAAVREAYLGAEAPGAGAAEPAG